MWLTRKTTTKYQSADTTAHCKPKIASAWLLSNMNDQASWSECSTQSCSTPLRVQQGSVHVVSLCPWWKTKDVVMAASRKLPKEEAAQWCYGLVSLWRKNSWWCWMETSTLLCSRTSWSASSRQEGFQLQGAHGEASVRESGCRCPGPACSPHINTIEQSWDVLEPDQRMGRPAHW